MVVRILRTDPWSADLTFGAAQLFLRIGDGPDANATFNQFIRIAPNSPLIRHPK